MDHNKRRILNPFAEKGEYLCFGCDPHNPIGLKLQFVLSGEEVSAVWEPRPDLEGYPGLIHGGIQATLADEIGVWYVYTVFGTAGATESLEIKYKRPALRADGPFTIRARGERDGRRHVRIHVTLENASGEVCTEAECVYIVFSEVVARRRFDFPGKEAFFDPD